MYIANKYTYLVGTGYKFSNQLAINIGKMHTAFHGEL